MGLFDFLFGKKKENTTVVFGVEEILPNSNDFISNVNHSSYESYND